MEKEEEKDDPTTEIAPQANPGIFMRLKSNILNRDSMRDLEGDKMHVLVLFFLYILQGIPLGLIHSVPLVLGKKEVTYKEQAKFSISSYPFSMKLLWAPLVDSLYVARFGRRKSWLVPVQYIIGIMMLVTSQYVGQMLGDPEEGKEPSPPDVTSLTATFFILNFLAATQDVAVDGWALTMLKPKNVGYASTCNSVGQTTGWCLGYILFLTLEGAGLVTLGQFLLFWGIVFLVTTTLIAIFKQEKNAGESKGDTEEPSLGLVDTYRVLWKIIRNPRIPVYSFFLLTHGIGYAAVEAMTSLKLVERGVPKAKIALLEIPMIPVKIILTLFLTRFTIGPRPMNVYLASLPWRLLFCLFMVLVVYIAPMVILDDGAFPTYYYGIIIAVLALHKCGVYAMFVSGMAFAARVSDPAVGGTYMTFINTLSNLGNLWPKSFSLWFVDQITWKQCTPDFGDLGASLRNLSLPGLEHLGSPLARANQGSILENVTSANLGSFGSLGNLDHSNLTAIGSNFCHGTEQVERCKSMIGTCDTLHDGFFALSIASVVLGALWFVWAFRAIRALQRVEVAKWRVVSKVEVEAETNENETKGDDRFKYFYCF